MDNARENNRLVILNALYEKQYTSRTELSKLLSISKPSIAYNLSDLLQLGIVEETGEGESPKSGGRKPRMLRFNKEFGTVVAIDLNFNDPIFAIGNLNGEIYNEFSVKLSEYSTAHMRLDLLKNAVSLLLNSANSAKRNLIAIAIAAPGVFPKSSERSFVNPQFQEWFKLDIVKSLAEEFKVNTILKNDVNMAALGEYNHSSADGLTSILYVSCGMGIGAGLILNGKLYEGNYNSAGEIFNNISPSKLGTGINLENTVSIDALVKRVRKSSAAYDLEARGKTVNFCTVAEEYQNGSPVIKKFIHEIGVEVGCVAANIANLLSLDAIIFGGEYSVFSDTIIECIEEIAKSHCIIPPAIRLSELGRHAGIMGLFAAVREQCFESIVNKDIADGVEKGMIEGAEETIAEEAGAETADTGETEAGAASAAEKLKR